MANVVSGNELVERLNELPTLPRLVVLASCQSAGSGSVGRDTEQTLAALGPRLAEAGIPAVLAMQGNVALLTLEHFMPAFFRELQRDGLVDRAMTAARSLVRDANDWWMPVLFMRLRSGRIWYVPGFSDEQRGF
ncbi:MAG: CHAT domain-containing protein, partial [Chloroflexaceae bacterium]|nr:CHAT domain-containing protein [Chloroflexaceae bacterium]